MKTGVVILNFNCWKKTTELALKTASFGEIDAVVVIDNVSTDDSYKHLTALNHEKIHVLQSKKNGGYSYGNNYGAEVCRKLGMEIMFISNPDVDIEEDTVRKIKTHFTDGQYAVLSGVEYDIKGNLVWPPLCRRREYWDDFFDCFFTGRKLCGKKLVAALDRTARVQNTEMIKGSFFAVRMDDFIKAEGFDENVFLFCEERILSKKMEKLGRKTGIVTDAKYMHTHSAAIRHTYGKVSRQMEMLYASRLYYNKKYNHIGRAKYALLLVAMKISVFEYYMRDTFRSKLTGEKIC